ncbi:MAG: hypothetical protein FAZ92_03883 [Accumulibacter sp.]|nr:MAG: hypothetical protein FAZ92_03883 [Accumulibacter sp.]
MQARVVRRTLRLPHGGIGEELLQALLEAGHCLLAQVVGKRHSWRRREIRQVALAEGELQVAAPGDLDRVGECRRQVGEQLDHLFAALEVLFLAVEARAACIAEHVAFGDAHPRLVCVEVLAIEELDRVRGDQRQPEFCRQVGGGGNQKLLLRQPRALDFEVEGVGEQLAPMPRAFGSLVAVALQEGLSNVAASGTRERDEPVDADFAQHQAADLRPAADAWRQIGARQQLAKLQVAALRAAEQEQPVRTIGIGLVGNEDVAAEQRLDPLAACRRMKLDEAKYVGQIGQRQRRHAAGNRAADGSIETDDAVRDRVLAVQAEVDVRCRGHARILLRGAHQQTPGGRCADPGADGDAGPRRRAPDRSGAAAQLFTQSMIGCHCSRSFAARDAERSNMVMPCIVVCT